MAEWSKALVLGTSLFGGVGSNPTPVTFAERSIHLTWGISSIGRVRRSQRRGTGIETRILHSFTNLVLYHVKRFHSLVVRTPLCGSGNPGSNPGGGIYARLG